MPLLKHAVLTLYTSPQVDFDLQEGPLTRDWDGPRPDAGTPFNAHDGYAYEIELLQTMLGMTAREALYTSTAGAADLLGIERGRLAVGDVADLVVLASDVASDARPFRDPLAVVKDGTLAFERR